LTMTDQKVILQLRTNTLKGSSGISNELTHMRNELCMEMQPATAIFKLINRFVCFFRPMILCIIHTFLLAKLFTLFEIWLYMYVWSFITKNMPYSPLSCTILWGYYTLLNTKMISFERIHSSQTFNRRGLAAHDQAHMAVNSGGPCTKT
jgi:hypothetical protein